MRPVTVANYLKFGFQHRNVLLWMYRTGVSKSTSPVKYNATKCSSAAVDTSFVKLKMYNLWEI